MVHYLQLAGGYVASDGFYSTAIGYKSLSDANHSIALGEVSKALGDNSVAINRGVATGMGSLAIGVTGGVDVEINLDKYKDDAKINNYLSYYGAATASGTASVAINGYAKNDYDLAIFGQTGVDLKESGLDTGAQNIAIGVGSMASYNSTALGIGSMAAGKNSLAVSRSVVTGDNSVGVGLSSVSGNNSVAINGNGEFGASVLADNSYVIGRGHTGENGQGSFVLGYGVSHAKNGFIFSGEAPDGNIVRSSNALAEGADAAVAFNTSSSGKRSFSFLQAGNSTNGISLLGGGHGYASIGIGSTLFGEKTDTLLEKDKEQLKKLSDAYTAGMSKTTYGDAKYGEEYFSHYDSASGGIVAQASGPASIAMLGNTNGNGNTAIGVGSRADGDFSVALGGTVLGTGNNGYEVNFATALGTGSFTEKQLGGGIGLGFEW